jgi:hypothetical protein
VLRAADGKPAADVRVAAVPQTDTLEETATGLTLSSLVQTDTEGRYKLENVPPGRYYVAAGRLDLPTFYPGTQSLAAGRTVLVSAGATVSEINFVLNANSAGRADPLSGIAPARLLALSLDVRVEGGGKLPVLSGGKSVTLGLTPVTGTAPPQSVAINAGSFGVAPPAVDYRVTVENLPAGYTVKSIKLDSKELQDRTLKLNGVGVTSTGPVGFTNFAAYSAFMTGQGFAAATPTATPGAQAMSIVLDSAAASSARDAGVRVTGKLPPNTIRTLYLTGAPGTVFSDATFEFRNVPPGRHTLMTMDNSPLLKTLVAIIVVGSTNLTNVEVVSTPALPLKASAGATRLASLRGRILDAESGTPVAAGKVFIVGETWEGLDLAAEGKFEFPNLLPGSYELEVQGFGYPTFRRPLVIDDKDVDLELKTN